MSPRAKVRSRIRPTWQGVFWLLLAAVLLAQGWYRTIGLLAFLAFFLFGLMAIEVLYIVWWRRGLNRLQIKRRLPEVIVAGQPFFMELEIENPGWRQLGLRIEDLVEAETGGRPSAGQPTQWSDYLWQLPRKEKRVRRMQRVLPQRGKYRWSGIRVSTGFPLGLCRREAYYELVQERVVLPPVGQVNLPHLQSVLELQPPRTATPRPWQRPLPGAEFEFHGLREYRSGDSPRYVHWRSSARTGQLLVREMEPPASEDLVLVLEAWRPDSNAEAAVFADLEEAISLAASVVLAWNRQAGCHLALLVLDRPCRILAAETATPSVRNLLEALALVQGCAEPELADVITTPSRDARLPGLPFQLRQAPVLWISSRTNTPISKNLPLPVALWTTPRQAQAAGWYNPPAVRPWQQLHPAVD